MPNQDLHSRTNISRKYRTRPKRPASLQLERLEDRKLLTTVIFEDSFEDGVNSNDWQGAWVEDSQSDWFRNGQRATDGSVSAEVDGYASNATLTMVTPVDLGGATSAQLTFDWLIEQGFDSGEYLSLDISADGGGTWQNDVRRLNGNVDTEHTWHSETIDLSPYASSNTLIRFRAKASRSNEDANLDNVKIVASFPSGLPALSITDTSVVEGDSAIRFIDDFVPVEGGQIDSPEHMEFGPDGNLYVVSMGSAEVLRFDPVNGTFIDAFVTAGSGGLYRPFGFAFSDDGDLFVSSRDNDNILRYDGTTGAFVGEFVTAGSGGLEGPQKILFGPDGQLYVASRATDQVLRYDGNTGAFIDAFVTAGGGLLDKPTALAFGPDGNLYVATPYSIFRYDGTTGAFIDEFVTNQAGGLTRALHLDFAADGHLYVTSSLTHAIQRYNGTTGAFIDEFIPAELGGLNNPSGFAWGADGNLYVGNRGSSVCCDIGGNIKRFGDASQAVFDVSLPFSSQQTITVDFASSDGTATGGSDFQPVSGTLTFEPGVTQRTIVAATIDDATFEASESFSVLLNSASNATILDGVGIATILDDDPVTPNEPPIADAGGPYFGNESSGIGFNGLGSSDSDGAIVSYDWDFDNDGDFDDAFGANPIFSSNQDGVYTIRLRVTDDDGDSSTDTAQVTVNNVAPTADAGGPYATEINADVTVTAAASIDPGNDIASYEWDLDNDGQFDDATGVTATFNSAVAGAFAVNVRVTDDDGAFTTDSAIVTVNDPGPPLNDEALIAHWTLDNTTADSAPYGSVPDNGSLAGNASFVTDATRGQVIELDGNGDRFDVPDSTDLNRTIVSQRTVSLWFKADTVTTRQVLFEEGGGTRGLSIYIDGGQLYVGGWNKPGGESGWGGTFLSTAVTAGAWHNVVLTLDGSTNVQADAFKGYLDGALFGSGDGSQIWSHSGDVGIGMMDDSTVFHDGNAGGDGFGFAGRMDDVRIYDRVFAGSEVEDLWLNY